LPLPSLANAAIPIAIRLKITAVRIIDFMLFPFKLNSICVFVLVEVYEWNSFNVTMLNTYSSKGDEIMARVERK
jgi:hypothetical protein